MISEIIVFILSSISFWRTADADCFADKSSSHEEPMLSGRIQNHKSFKYDEKQTRKMNF